MIASLPKGFPERTREAPLGFTTQCWEWTGHVDRCGYARIGGRSAHRLAYEALVGPIPKGLQIDHLCRVRHCVNPAHMEPVTLAENVRRGLKGEAKTHCAQGHRWENLYVAPSGRHDCRACIRQRARDYARRKAAA